MGYVDGFVIPVPKDQREAYRTMAAQAASIWLEHGALRVVECWGDDVSAGTKTDFFMSVKAESNENVVFSWVVWPSRAARDEGNARIMADPRMKTKDDPVGMDMTRLVFGGFEVLVDTDNEAPY